MSITNWLQATQHTEQKLASWGKGIKSCFPALSVQLLQGLIQSVVLLVTASVDEVPWFLSFLLSLRFPFLPWSVSSPYHCESSPSLWHALLLGSGRQLCLALLCSECSAPPLPPHKPTCKQSLNIEQFMIRRCRRCDGRQLWWLYNCKTHCPISLPLLSFPYSS